MQRKFISAILAAWLMLMLSATAFAQSFDAARTGSVSVSLMAQNGEEPIVGAELSLYRVAAVGLNNENNLSYTLTDAFKPCGCSLTDPELARTLDSFVSGHSVPAERLVTDAEGKAFFTDLPLGLYFVKQTGAVSGYAPCTSFLVTVPCDSSEGYVYAVDASPKTDVAKLTDLTVKKVWNTGAYAAAADSVTVQLLREGAVVETATLSLQNDWQVTYTDMPESDAYSIVEVDIPAGFTATYSKSGYVFTVTNTATLAQTGQLIWPIPVLAMLGLCLPAVGAVVLKKPERKMRKVCGLCCILLGICCLISSLGLIAYNRSEEESAQKASDSILHSVLDTMPDNSPENIPAKEIAAEALPEMLSTQVDGYDCIGILSIPVLELELPVLTDWSYEKLNAAPCRYFGSCYEKDFVIAAHNYQSHFGRLSQLQPGDLILFTDISATVYCYEVVLLETLPANATEEMLTSGFDLSLYTCTPGGGSRVTVRCSTAED